MLFALTLPSRRPSGIERITAPAHVCVPDGYGIGAEPGLHERRSSLFKRLSKQMRGGDQFQSIEEEEESNKESLLVCERILAELVDNFRLNFQNPHFGKTTIAKKGTIANEENENAKQICQKIGIDFVVKLKDGDFNMSSVWWLNADAENPYYNTSYNKTPPTEEMSVTSAAVKDVKDVKIPKVQEHTRRLAGSTTTIKPAPPMPNWCCTTSCCDLCMKDE